MSQPRSRAAQFLYFTLFICSWIHSVLGDDQQSRLDVLQGNNGESSCTLKSNIYKGCNVSPPSTYNATYETPASCTCNKIFFNIWSACSYSIGENLFPIFKDWTTTCSNSGINLEQSQYLADTNAWGVNVPKWARIDVPGNQTMDLQNAVLTTRSNWSVLQILLPFIAALVAIFISVLVMKMYYHHRQRGSWRERMLRIVRPIPKVKNVEKYDAWEIEANDGGQYELVAPSSGASDAYAFGPQSAQQLQAQQALHRGGHRKTDSEAFEGDDASGWGSLRNMRMPWKKGPNRVQEVDATTEFDIDDFNRSSTTIGPTSDGESQNRPEGDLRLVSQTVPQPKDYNDPFGEQKSHP